MARYFDISAAQEFTSNMDELRALLHTFEGSLREQVTYFQALREHLGRAPLQTKHNRLGTRDCSGIYAKLIEPLRPEILEHLHQMLGFLPLFSNEEVVERIKSIKKLIFNNSFDDLHEPFDRIQGILECLQSELSEWSAQ